MFATAGVDVPQSTPSFAQSSNHDFQRLSADFAQHVVSSLDPDSMAQAAAEFADLSDRYAAMSRQTTDPQLSRVYQRMSVLWRKTAIRADMSTLSIAA